MWAHASFFRRFTDTELYETSFVKMWKTRHKISVDVRIFFTVYVMMMMMMLLLSANAGLIAGLCIFFLIILPLLILGAICGYRHRDRLLSFWQRTKNQMQNASER